MTMPKKLWIDPDYLDGETDCISRVKVLDRDFEYIRADLVEELASLLKEWNTATAEEDKDWFDYESRVNAALEALEGDNGN